MLSLFLTSHGPNKVVKCESLDLGVAQIKFLQNSCVGVRRVVGEKIRVRFFCAPRNRKKETAAGVKPLDLVAGPRKKLFG